MNERQDRPPEGATDVDLAERRARRRERASRQADARDPGAGERGPEAARAEESRQRDRTPTFDTSDEGRATLLPESEAERFRARWKEIQTGFVDSPRHTVKEADSLVADVLDRIQDVFTNERETLESQWDGGEDISTEDLRQGLRRYRAFFDRLLSL